MARMDDENQAAHEALTAGELDSLSPEQAARLALHLNSNRDAAALMGRVAPRVEPVLQAGIPAPSAGAWERVWDRIDGATGTTARAARRPRVLRLWAPLVAAAAACVLLVGVWSLTRAREGNGWPVTWARNVEIDSLEVSDHATALVLSAGTDDPIPVIWVLDEQG